MHARQPQSSKISPTSATMFLDLLNALRRVDPEFPLQYAICLTEIAMNEGLSLTQLAERTHLALSTVSRIVGALSTVRQSGEAYGLVMLKISPQERRRKELSLTPKGWAVMHGVMDVFNTPRAAG
jgi:DNA-binding MarR family transcriptional regulator